MDWNAKVKEALDRTEFMAISTIGPDGSWTNPVQYGHSEKLDLYFISMFHSKHVQNLLKDNRVSVAIFKTERFDDGEVLGLQLKGLVSQITSRKDIEEASRNYYGVGYESKVENHIGEAAKWKFFKIIPDELWCFDSRVFGDERKQVPLESILL